MPIAVRASTSRVGDAVSVSAVGALRFCTSMLLHAASSSAAPSRARDDAAASAASRVRICRVVSHHQNPTEKSKKKLRLGGYGGHVEVVADGGGAEVRDLGIEPRVFLPREQVPAADARR